MMATTSIADPRCDFKINAMGTFNNLEAACRVPELGVREGIARLAARVRNNRELFA
jgi:hypothetical protein